MSNQKFNLIEDSSPNMALQYFHYELDNRNNVVINWTWPVSRTVKLMIVFEWGHDTENLPDIKQLLQNNHPHEFVFRDLKAEYSTHISHGRHKFLICPGYFEDNDDSVIIYKPTYVTDWLYRRTPLVAKAIYKPLPLGQFQRVNLKVTTTEIKKEGKLPTIVAEALSYSIWTHNQLIGKYPLDMNVINGDYYFYIKKDQTVTFTLDESYSHILALES